MFVKSILSTAAIILTLAANMASAATVNATGKVTNNIIFGSGNANAAFTGVTIGGLELGLRAKLRYDASSSCAGGFGCAQNTFNYDGNSTYSFASNQSHAPANRSIFNFEWSINSNTNGTGTALNGLSYMIDIDTNPSAVGGFWVSYNPLSFLSTGYYLGTNASPAGGAPFRSGGTGNLSAFNLAQNSVNFGFLPGTNLGSGQFTIRLSAFRPGNVPYASTSINVLVDVPAPIPLPAGLPLLCGALAGLAMLRRRRG